MNADTPEKRKFVQQFADVMLCREMGWTERQLTEDNSEEFIETCMKVFSMEASFIEGERKMAAKRAKRRR